MKRILTALVLLAVSPLLRAEDPHPVDQSSPTPVLEAVFAAARSGQLARLTALAASTADGDVESVCGVSTASPEIRESFRTHFAKGKIIGKPRLDGNRAEIDFLFGPDGRKKETMHLVRENGLWFLESF